MQSPHHVPAKQSTSIRRENPASRSHCEVVSENRECIACHALVVPRYRTGRETVDMATRRQRHSTSRSWISSKRSIRELSGKRYCEKAFSHRLIGFVKSSRVMQVRPNACSVNDDCGRHPQFGKSTRRNHTELSHSRASRHNTGHLREVGANESAATESARAQCQEPAGRSRSCRQSQDEYIARQSLWMVAQRQYCHR